MKQDDGEARRVATLFEGHAQHRRVDAPLDRSDPVSGPVRARNAGSCPSALSPRPSPTIPERFGVSCGPSPPSIREPDVVGIPAPTDRLDRSMSEPERVTLRSPPDDARPTFMQRGQTCKRRRPGAWSDKSPIRGSVKTTGNTETAGGVKSKPVYPLRSQRALC